ncbi:ABC-type nitrate/sulfonate/bicarbonate transport system, permease component [Cupriavidus sp. H18C2]
MSQASTTQAPAPIVAAAADRAPRARHPWLSPLVPVSSRARWMLGLSFFVLFFGVWAAATLGGFVSRTFLADPLTMANEGWLLFTQYGFIGDIGMTVWRVVGGFVLAAVLAVPLGILMGSYKAAEAFFEPFVSFCRYLPASAFIPLLILWAGIGETQKLLASSSARSSRSC